MLDVDSEIIVWDTVSGERLPSFTLPFISWGPQVNHAEDRLAVGSNEGDGRILILDSLTGEIMLDFKNPFSGFILYSPIWSPDDSSLIVASGSNEDSVVSIWNTATGQLLYHVAVQELTNSQVIALADGDKSLIFSDGRSFPINIALSNIVEEIDIDGSG